MGDTQNTTRTGTTRRHSRVLELAYWVGVREMGLVAGLFRAVQAAATGFDVLTPTHDNVLAGDI